MAAGLSRSRPAATPHLGELWTKQPVLQQADIAAVVARCSNLKALCCHTLPSSLTPALVPLLGLTRLQLHTATDEECSAMAQLTGLRQLMVMDLKHVSVVVQLVSLGFGTSYRSQLGTLADHLLKDNLPCCLHALNNKVSGKAYGDVC